MTDSPKIPDTDLIQRVGACVADTVAPSPVVDCGITLHVAFCFDGRGRHGETDDREGRPSNVRKLYWTHADQRRDTATEKYRRRYISGLGTPFNPSFAAALNAAGSVAGKTAADQAKDAAKDRVKEAAKTIVWKGAGGWRHEVRQELQQLWKHPGKAIRGAVVGVAVNVGARVGFESTPAVRDDPRMVNVMLSGAETRVAAAVESLWSALEEVQAGSKLPVKAVKLSVFGYDTGGVLARALVRKVLEEKSPVPVTVVFAGLLDSVGRSRPKEWTKIVPGVSALDLTNTEIEDGGPLHPKVKAALHLVAAHERRYTHTARLLGPLQPNWREVLVPGNSEDVGGGVRAGDQGRPSADFALTALYRMHRAASFAGVPLVPIENLTRELGHKIAALYASRDFVRLNPGDAGAARLPAVTHHNDASSFTVHGVARWYEDHAGASTKPGQEGFMAHLRVYMQWLGYMHEAYHDVLRSNEDTRDAVNGDVVVRMGRVFGTEAEPERKRREQTLARLDEERKAMQRTLGWLDDVQEESAVVANRLRAYGYNARGNAELTRNWIELQRVWRMHSQSSYLNKAEQEIAARLPPPPPQLHALFGSFLHDPLAWNRQGNASPTLAVMPMRFFDSRLFETPED